METQKVLGHAAQKAKRKTIKLKDGVTHYIYETPLFRILLEKAKLYFHNPEELNDEITRFYNEATGEQGKKNVADFWEKVRKVYFMLRDAINNRYSRLPKAKIIIGLAVLVYAILPSDLMPDVLPVFGFSDDAALLAWFVKNAAQEIHEYEQWIQATSSQPAY